MTWPVALTAVQHYRADCDLLLGHIVIFERDIIVTNVKKLHNNDDDNDIVTMKYGSRVQYTSLVAELEKFLSEVKDELIVEVQSLQLFPFEQANVTSLMRDSGKLPRCRLTLPAAPLVSLRVIFTNSYLCYST